MGFPRYLTDIRNNSPFFILNKIPEKLKDWNITSKSFKWDLTSFEKITTSSKYTKHDFQLYRLSPKNIQRYLEIFSWIY